MKSLIPVALSASVILSAALAAGCATREVKTTTTYVPEAPKVVVEPPPVGSTEPELALEPPPPHPFSKAATPRAKTKTRKRTEESQNLHRAQTLSKGPYFPGCA